MPLHAKPILWSRCRERHGGRENTRRAAGPTRRAVTTTGRVVSLSLLGLGGVGLIMPGAAQVVLVVALLHLGVGMALPAFVGKRGPETGDLPGTLVLLSVGRAVAALAVVRAVVGPVAQLESLAWVPEALGPLGAPALFAAVAVIAGIMVSSGAVRVAEVAARFALDAMPGKQLGLDTVLQRGSLDAAAAAERLQALDREAGFFGAMDGATRFLRAESIALTGVGVVGIALAGGLHPASWAKPAAFAAAVFALLLTAAAATGTQAALAVTHAAGGGHALLLPVAVRPKSWAAFAVAVGALLLIIGVLSRPVAGLTVALGASLLIGAAVAVLRTDRLMQRPSRAGIWALCVSPSLRAVAGDEISSVLSLVREDLKLRLGFDPGEALLVFADWASDRQVEVRVRDMLAGPVDVYPERRLVPCPTGGSDAGTGAASVTPDGRAAVWVDAAGPDGWDWREVFRWGIFARLVTVAPLLFTAEHAAEWVERARDKLPASAMPGPGAAWLLGAMRDLLRWGLPVVAPALVAEVAAEGEGDAQRAMLRRLAAHTMFAEARGALLARQLHPDGRALLDRLEEGQPVGRELDSLRAVLLAEAHKRPDWRWPVVFVESRYVEQLTALLAGKTDQAVVLRPEELPMSLPLPPIEVLGNGLRESL